MDPFTHNLLGAIRQQEILEEVAKGRRGEREWRWKFIETVFEERQQIEEAGAYVTETVSLRQRLSSLISLILKFRQRASFGAKFAAQEQSAVAQSYTDAQCVEC